MLRSILVFGLIGAVVCGGLMVAGALPWASGGEHSPENGLVVGYLTQLVALTVVFLGVKHHRDRTLGGAIRFLPAFGMGLAISAVATLGWVFGWEIVLVMTGPDYGAMMAEQATASGADEAKIAELMAFAEAYRNPLVRMPISFIEMFPLGVVISLVTALVLRNRRFMPPRAAGAG